MIEIMRCGVVLAAALGELIGGGVDAIAGALAGEAVCCGVA